jgi:predicted kinase
MTEGTANPVRSPAPQAVLVCGAPGSGKSTLATLLARRLRAALLDLDTATAGLTAIIGTLQGTDDLDDPELAHLTRAARYEAIIGLAEENLIAGVGAVMVAPFTTERRDPLAWAALQSRLDLGGAGTTMVWLRISADEVLRRVERRGAGRDVAKLRRNWPAGLDLGPPSVPHIAVDATLTPALIADRVLSRLPGRTGG